MPLGSLQTAWISTSMPSPRNMTVWTTSTVPSLRSAWQSLCAPKMQTLSLQRLKGKSGSRCCRSRHRRKPPAYALERQADCRCFRDFLNTNGCAKHADAVVPAMPAPTIEMTPQGGTLREKILHHAGTLGICLERGLTERFDGSIGANSVFMPFGGKNQLTPAQVMAATLPALHGQCSTVSVMAFGFDPYYTEQNPFLGASAAVVESVQSSFPRAVTTRPLI